MKKLRGVVATYSVYDNDTLIAKGSSSQLADELGVEQKNICECARGGKKLLRQYTVVREEDEMKPEMRERLDTIRKLYSQGVSVPMMSKQIDLDASTIYSYIRRMKKKGEIA